MSEWIQYFAARDPLTDLYVDKMRTILFSGFLTLSGFMFTVKTFLIVRLQQDVYGDERYQNWVLKVARKYNKSITVYGSLRRLGKLLFWSVCCSFGAALSQVTLGFVEKRWSTWIVLAVTVAAGVLFLFTLIVVRGVVRKWIDFQESKCDERLRKELAQSVADDA